MSLLLVEGDLNRWLYKNALIGIYRPNHSDNHPWGMQKVVLKKIVRSCFSDKYILPSNPDEWVC